jgi:hypothetical protein
MTDIEYPEHPARLPAPEHEVHLLGEVAFEPPDRPLLPGDRGRMLAGAACWVGVMLGVAWLSDWLGNHGTDGRDEGRTR